MNYTYFYTMNLLFISDKNIINEQFLLNRLASAAIDIYVTTCMLSRCTQSLNEGLPSAMHEELLTKVHYATHTYCQNRQNFNIEDVQINSF